MHGPLLGGIEGIFFFSGNKRTSQPWTNERLCLYCSTKPITLPPSHHMKGNTTWRQALTNLGLACQTNWKERPAPSYKTSTRPSLLIVPFFNTSAFLSWTNFSVLSLSWCYGSQSLLPDMTTHCARFHVTHIYLNNWHQDVMNDERSIFRHRSLDITTMTWP